MDYQYERREGDSNPRRVLPRNGFRDRRIQPLCHLSINKNIFRYFTDIWESLTRFYFFLYSVLLANLA